MDPLTLALVESALNSAIREMTITLRRVARSPIFVIGHDFSDCLFDADGKMVAMGHDQPVHLGAMGFGLRDGLLTHYDRAEIHQGDIFQHNDPESLASHLPDMTVYKPIFAGGELLFWAASRGHVNEIGGPVPGGYNPGAEDIFAEGLRIPPTKIYERGKPRQDVLRLMGQNVRSPREFFGDLGGQIAAVNIAERRLSALAERYGNQVVTDCLDTLFERSRTMMRDAISRIPDGTYHGRGVLDNEGFECGQLEVHAEVTVSGERIRVALSAPDQVKHPINSYSPNTTSGLYYGVMSFIDATVPRNDGAFGEIEVALGPKGTIVNASAPGACSNSTGITIEAVCDAVTDALNDAMPDEAYAGAGTWCTYSLSGIDPATSEFYNYTTHMAAMGGGGAAFGADGWPCAGGETMGGAGMTGDVELLEYRVPFTIRRFELQQDSAAPGRWRGGLGSVFDATIDHDDATIANTGDGSLNPALSAAGAGPRYRQERKRHHRELVRAGTGEVEYMPTNSMFKADKGDRIVARQGGGGGVGNPFERLVDLVADDVRNELVSVTAAEIEYGVFIDPRTLAVDVRATDELRARLLAERPGAGELRTDQGS